MLPSPSPVPALTRPAPLRRLPGPRRHGSRAPCRSSSPRSPCCPRRAGLILRSGARRQRCGSRDRGRRTRGRGGGSRRRLGVRAGAAAAHRAGGRGGEQSRFRFRSRYAHTRADVTRPALRPSHAMFAVSRVSRLLVVYQPVRCCQKGHLPPGRNPRPLLWDGTGRCLGHFSVGLEPLLQPGA